ncbi:hypothetical protein XHC_2453 [Xanthomonas hortorum pv. carotae str. M081]|nr:hypothetical protein XHC_2453 [Xanthomonas hortorum pv. carotae str. M081]
MHGPNFRFWRHRYQQLVGKAPDSRRSVRLFLSDTDVRAAEDGRARPIPDCCSKWPSAVSAAAVDLHMRGEMPGLAR